MLRERTLVRFLFKEVTMKKKLWMLAAILVIICGVCVSSCFRKSETKLLSTRPKGYG